MNERPTEEEIERARRAIMDAPATESGIVLPPHVAAAVKQVGQGMHVTLDETSAQPNRAQRRWQAKQERRRRAEEAKRARMRPEARDALKAFEKAAHELPPEKRLAAAQMVKTIAALPEGDRLALLREMAANDAA